MVKLFVIVLLCQGNDVLLVRRYHTTFGDGEYSLVGGKVEPGETAKKAIKREVLEETTLDIPENAFELVHTFHRNGTEYPLIALVFKANITGMQPQNAEPDKHDDMRFFKIDKLPEGMIPAHKQAINCISEKISYSEHGW